MGNSKGAKKPIESDRAVAQILVLKAMCDGVCSVHEARQYHIQELASVLGSDEREVQRSLYILEGHKFVSPYPAGDFTSKTWTVTEGGINAVRNYGGAARIF